MELELELSGPEDRSWRKDGEAFPSPLLAPWGSPGLGVEVDLGAVDKYGTASQSWQA